VQIGYLRDLKYIDTTGTYEHGAIDFNWTFIPSDFANIPGDKLRLDFDFDVGTYKPVSETIVVPVIFSSVHNLNTSLNYSAIQEAIDAPETLDGHTITVDTGTYVENVAVNKRLTLIGEGADVVTVRAADMEGHVFNVTADWVNVSGFAVAGAGYLKAGLHLSNGVDHCNISDNNVSNNYYGIRLYGSSENTLVGNTADSNNDTGICLWHSSNNTLANSAISNNRCGILLSESSDNTLTNNTADSNDRCGIRLHSSSGNTLTGNTVNSNNRGSNSYVNNGRGGIYLWISCGNTLANNAASSNNENGICLDKSSNNTLANNTANSNNLCGICLDMSNNNTLANNAASSNNRCGIYLDSSSNNTLRSNTMSGNRYNFGVFGFSLSKYTQNIDTSNTVDGKPIYYWVNQKDGQIPSDAGFVGVVNGTNITVIDLTLTNNNHGVLFTYTTNSRIENVTVSSNNRYGIYLYHSSGNMLANNTANSNNGCGIGIWSSSSNNTLANNNCSNNWCGIHIWISCDNTLVNNTASSNNDNGIDLSSSSGNTLKSNTMSGNAYNFGVYGSSLSECTQNIDTSNTVDGKPIYYWVNQKDGQIPSDAGFVWVVNGTNITVIDLTLTNNSHGVLFANTRNSSIENVTASNNYLGISVRSSSNNMFVSNNCSDNDNGIRLYDSSGNLVYNNCFNNMANTYDNGTNQWDSGTVGNYYSDYTGADNNTDGIGDDPYDIPGGTSVDRYPIMRPRAATSLKGDLNGDNRITPADAAIALRIAATGAHDPAADVNGDDRVTSLDALMILQAAAGRIEL
jgi:parallel beta-helix repeat protein